VAACFYAYFNAVAVPRVLMYLDLSISFVANFYGMWTIPVLRINCRT